MQLININKFIKDFITKRSESLFEKDLNENHARLTEAISEKSVLVIGGAGTIGSSFIKALLKYRPERLFVVDTNENGLTELTRDLRSTYSQFMPATYITYPMNFADTVFQKMLVNEGPFQIVANFAAHKHVRSEKDHYSIEAMLENNVFKAKELLDLLVQHKPEHFFCVSTDKAANPVNVMGASKKLMEETIMAYCNELKITTARFANVAFSNGSLLAGYIERFMKSQPLSCPEDVKRFFVSPEESGQICLLACILGKSGEIFFPKLENSALISFKDITIDLFNVLGQKIKVFDSEDEAKSFASKRTESDEYPVFFFKSDTSGEKMFEEFYTDTDDLDMSTFDGLGVIKNSKKVSKSSIETTIVALRSALTSGMFDKASIVNALKQYLPDFEHIETGKNLDSKM